MEQILIVSDDSEINESEMAYAEKQHNSMDDVDINIGEIRQLIDYLCRLYVVDRKGIEGVVEKINNSITARYVITAVTTLRSSSSIKEMMNAANEKQMSDALSSSIINMYTDNDGLKNQIDKASETVSRIKDTNNDMRQMFETEIKAAFDREKEATTALIEQYKISLEAKDKTYTLIMHNNNEIKKENSELKEQLNKLKVKNDELKAMMTLQAKSSMTDRDIHVSGTANEKEKSGLLSIFRKDRNNRDNSISQHMDEFISEILSNKDFSKEQKDYLMSCVESGMSYNEVKRIANKELDVDMMKRLVRYYKK